MSKKEIIISKIKNSLSRKNILNELRKYDKIGEPEYIDQAKNALLRSTGVSTRNARSFWILNGNKRYPLKIIGRMAALKKGFKGNNYSSYWREAFERLGFEVPHDAELNDISGGLKSSDGAGLEGGKKAHFVTTYERDPKLRQKAIELRGVKCIACGFDFEHFYGEYASGYIQIHHIIPLFESGEKILVNPKTDLVPVCSNCHSIIHRRRDKTLSIEDIKTMINAK